MKSSDVRIDKLGSATLILDKPDTRVCWFVQTPTMPGLYVDRRIARSYFYNEAGTSTKLH